MCTTHKSSPLFKESPADLSALKKPLTQRQLSRQATVKKRKTQAAMTVEVKIMEDHLTCHQQEILPQFFLQSKWFKNDIVSFTKNESIKDYDARKKTVTVRMGKDSDEYEDRELSVLPASVKQGLRDEFKGNLKSLSTKKKNGQRVGRIDYTKEVTSILLRQYGTDFVILDSNHMRITKLGKVRVRGLSQIPQDADISNAKLVHKPDGYYVHITFFLPLEYNASIASREDVGLDFGIKKALTTSHGEEFDVFIPETTRLKKFQRKLAKAEKHSANWFKILHKVKREHQRMNNLKDEAANQIVHYLLTTYRFIYIQDENISGWKKLFGNKVHHSILGRIKKKLKAHPRVIVLKRSAATTQFCPHCHALNKMSLDKRIYTCGCGYSHHRDIHAAENMITMAHLFPHLIDKNIIENKVYVERMDDKQIS